MPTTRSAASAKKKRRARSPAAASQSPPRAPWVISTETDLRSDARDTATWKPIWASTYPGPSAAFPAKLAWAQHPGTSAAVSVPAADDDDAAAKTAEDAAAAGETDAAPESTTLSSGRPRRRRTPTVIPTLQSEDDAAAAAQKKKRKSALLASTTATGEVLADIVFEAASDEVEVALCCARDDAVQVIAQVFDADAFVACRERRRSPALFDEEDDRVDEQPAVDDDAQRGGLLSRGGAALKSRLRSAWSLATAPLARLLWRRRRQRPDDAVVSFALWLADPERSAAAGIVTGSGDDAGDLVVIATGARCAKSTPTDEALGALLAKLGFGSGTLSEDETGLVVTALDGRTRDTLGMHLSLSSAGGVDRVAFLAQPRCLLGSWPEAAGTTTGVEVPPDAAAELVTTAAEARAAARRCARQQTQGSQPTSPEDDDDDQEAPQPPPKKTFVLLANPSTHEEGADDAKRVTTTTGVVWLPASYEREAARVLAHCHAGVGESAKAQATLENVDSRQTATKAANLKVELFLAEARALKTRFAAAKGADADAASLLCAALALTRAAAPDVSSDWDALDEEDAEDNAEEDAEEPKPEDDDDDEDAEMADEEEEEVGSVDETDWLATATKEADVDEFISKKLAAAWRDILKHDDADLDIGLDGDEQVFSAADSRRSLLAYLSNVKDHFAEFDLKFNFKPLKRKSVDKGGAPASAAKRAKPPSTPTAAAAGADDEDDDDPPAADAPPPQADDTVGDVAAAEKADDDDDDL